MKRAIRLAAALIAVATASGCTTPQPETATPARSNESQSQGPARAEGDIGAAAARQTMLNQKLQGSGIDVDRAGDQIRLNLPAAIAFAMDDSALLTQLYPALDGVIEVLETHPDTRVEIDGYTDRTGSADYNRRLSERRAQAVGRYLARGGIDPGRLSVTGHGARHYAADNDTPRGRAKNRRVTLTLIPEARG